LHPRFPKVASEFLESLTRVWRNVDVLHTLLLPAEYINESSFMYVYKFAHNFLSYNLFVLRNLISFYINLLCLCLNRTNQEALLRILLRIEILQDNLISLLLEQLPQHFIDKRLLNSEFSENRV
jgi:hypothetical protein